MALHASVLTYFDTVARLGSIRKAADRLNVASSAINRQILKLEKYFGTQLFERLPRGMRLTAAGEVLIRHIRSTLRDFNSVRADIGELTGARKGIVTIASVEGMAAEFLPMIMSRFKKYHPGISFTVNIVTPDAVLLALRTNEADLGLMFNPPPQSGVKVVGNISLKIGAIMSPNHPLAKRKSVRMSECQVYPLILPDITLPNREWLNAMLDDSDIISAPAACSNSFQLMRALAKYNFGIAFQTKVGIEEEIRTKKIVYVPLSDRRLKPSVLSILVRNHELHAPASVFLKAVQEAVAELTYTTRTSSRAN
jgi:DNA-binding transcriptional LysR family regulator